MIVDPDSNEDDGTEDDSVDPDSNEDDGTGDD